MRILLTGGTGLIGRGLCRHLSAQGHELLVLSRRPQQVPRLCGAGVRGVATLAEVNGQAVDAVINLAGAPIADRPWSSSRRKLLWQSRVTLTERLVDWLAASDRPPAVLISGSAVGWYGDTGERLVDEASPPGADFAAQLCGAWEEAAIGAEALGVRVVRVRTGLVLARDGGFLARLLPVYRLGLGGRLGDGRQFMPWVHLQDQIGLIDFLLHSPTASGPYNACAPHPVRNADFSQALGHSQHRPARLPVPAALLKVGLGELSGLLLGGQRAVPARLQGEGFAFRFAELDAALADLFGSPSAGRP